ncbi:Conserved oligomeric Golgi complex subunit 4 [Smittium mucronatum]|uniref:Conserved oligomeric Golgi complex subunit 4 n=1 Tax=Smittium mucronatum TaxID=133383 RepID=A0A1R0GLT1_9FUNG|nr:Conserved oligomeric Golgi complex subunit 4 [Smittium mucronatum]
MPDTGIPVATNNFSGIKPSKYSTSTVGTPEQLQKTHADTRPSLSSPNLDLDLSNLLNLTELYQIEEAVDWLSGEEIRLDMHLDEILSTKNHLDTEFLHFLNTIPIIEEAQSDIVSIRDSVEKVYSKIEYLHEDLKILNENKRNISEIEDSIISDQIENGCRILQECLEINRSLDPSNNSLDPDTKSILNLILLQMNTPSNSMSAIEILEKHRIKLTQLVSSKFDKAVSESNDRAIIDCFKLFPLLNEKGLGLEKYSKLLCQKLSENYKLLKIQSDKEGAFMIRLTNLFDSVAYLIDSNTTLVERYYGQGSMIRIIEHLQLELDNRSVLILESFEDERQISKLKFQVQFSKTQILSDLSNISSMKHLDNYSRAPGTPGKIPPASKDDQQSLSKSTTILQNPQFDPVNDDVDVVSISKLVAELGMMVSKGQSFLQFLDARGKTESVFLRSSEFKKENILLNDSTLLENQRKSSILSKDIYSLDELSIPKLSIDKDTGLLTGTQLQSLIKWIQNTYIEFEIYSMQRAVLRALQLDDIDSLEGWDVPIYGDALIQSNNLTKSKFFFSKSKNNQFDSISLTSSITGDVFYVFQTALYRCINTRSPILFTELSAAACEILKKTYLVYLDNLIQSGWVYPSSNQNQNGVSNDQRSHKSPRGSSDFNRSSRETASLSISNSNSSLSALGTLGLGSSDWKQSFKNSISNSTFVSALGLNTSEDYTVQEQQKLVCVGLNNLDVSSSYLEALCDGLSNRYKEIWDIDSSEETPIDDAILSEVDAVNKAISSLNDVRQLLNNNLSQGLSNLGNQALKLRIRQALKDSYKDIKYVISNEDEFADLMDQPLFVTRLFKRLDLPLFAMFKNRLTTRNYGDLIGSIGLDFLIFDWQRAILQSKFNYLGGMLFERDVRLVLSRFEDLLEPSISNSKNGIDVRSKFAKLIQMASIMASSHSEYDSLSYDDGGTSVIDLNNNNKSSVNKPLNRTQSGRNKSALIDPLSGINDLGLKLEGLSSLSQNEISQLMSNRIEI